MPQLAIDHAVIAVRDLDAAASDFGRVGFTLTPRGHQSIGSQNRCILHPWLDYYRAFGEGLAAIALSTDDADATYAQLKDKGARAPMDLSRPVEGGVARFRLAQIESAPQLFFVQHLTRRSCGDRNGRSTRTARELVHVSLSAKKPFDGLPGSIDWNASGELQIEGLQKNLASAGVTLSQPRRRSK